MAPVFNAMTAPFLRPLRRFIPPLGNVDLTPLVLLVIIQILLIVLANVA
jgi:YggT family protein